MCPGDKSQVSGGGARDLPDCAEAIRVPSWQGCHRRPACTRGRRWRGTKTLRPEAKPASLPACDMPRRPHKREAGSGEPCCLSHSESSRRGEPRPGNQLSTGLWAARPPCMDQGLERQKLPGGEKSHQCGQCVQDLPSSPSQSPALLSLSLSPSLSLSLSVGRSRPPLPIQCWGKPALGCSCR